MLCEHCNKNVANTHIKEVINGNVSEHMLCDECAKLLGYNSLISDVHSDFSNFLGSFFSNALPERASALRCPSCDLSYNDILRTRLLGCAECFDTFSSDIKKSIDKIHNGATHTGKTPKNFESRIKKNDEIKKLKSELETAVEKQEFEKAATLRDKIKEMEG